MMNDDDVSFLMTCLQILSLTNGIVPYLQWCGLVSRYNQFLFVVDSVFSQILTDQINQLDFILSDCEYNFLCRKFCLEGEFMLSTCFITRATHSGHLFCASFNIFVENQVYIT